MTGPVTDCAWVMDVRKCCTCAYWLTPNETTMPVTTVFLPSQHGFAFSNAWPSQPALLLPTPFGDIRIGNADGGLCGGMVFATIDYWHSGEAPPPDPPGPGEPPVSHIVQRLIDSC